MISYFKTTRLYGNLYLLLFALFIKAAWIVGLFTNPLPANASLPFIEKLLTSTGGRVVYALLTFLFLYFSALLVNHIANRHLLLGQKTHIAALIFLLISGPFPGLHLMSIAGLLIILEVFIINKCFKMYQKSRMEANVFDIALLAGLGSIIVFPFAGWWVFILPVMLVLSHFSARLLGLALVGLAMPWYVWAVYLFLTNRFNVFNNKWLDIKAGFLQFPHFTFSNDAISLQLILLVTILSIIVYFLERRGMSQKIKFYFLCCIIVVICSGLAILLFPQHYHWLPVIILVPATYLISRLFFIMPRKLAGFLFIVLIGGIIAAQIIYIFV